MSDDRADETEAPAAAALAIPADSFRDVAVLLRLITDEKACARRLKQLGDMTHALDKQRVAVWKAQAEHAALVTKERQEIVDLKSALDKRELGLMAREGALDAAADRHRVTAAELDRLKGKRTEAVGSSGLTRSFSGSTGSKPEETEPRVVPHDDDFAAGTTIVRSPEIENRAKRSMRRVSP
jgi:hypothetical protein